MFSRHRLAEIAALIADPGRAGMLTALWDGGARPAGELASIAGVSPATASSHLAKLVNGGLLRVEPRGRHRYYRLAGAQVAHALESFSQLVPLHGGRDTTDSPLARARLCYDHIAGRLGVAIAETLLSRRWLAVTDGEFRLRPPGRRALERFGIAIDALEHGRRALLRGCLDWTERREHLGGALGAALASQLFERDWIRRERGARTLILTTAGRRGLAREFELREL